jgi:hypothetical protein
MADENGLLKGIIDPYSTLSSIYAVIRNAYAKKVYVDKAFQKKTNELVQQHDGEDHGDGRSLVHPNAAGARTNRIAHKMELFQR